MRYLEVYDVHARWRAGPGDPWQREHNVPRGGEQHTAVTAFRLQWSRYWRFPQWSGTLWRLKRKAPGYFETSVTTSPAISPYHTPEDTKPVCNTEGLTVNTLRTGDADLRFYGTTVQDRWRRFAFLTRWNSVHLQVLLSATPQGGMFSEVSHPQALLGSLVNISWKFQFTKIVKRIFYKFLKKHSRKVDYPLEKHSRKVDYPLGY